MQLQLANKAQRGWVTCPKSHSRGACAQGCSVGEAQGPTGGSIPTVPRGKNVEPGGRHPKFLSRVQHLLTCSGQFPWADDSLTLCFRACKVAVWCLPCLTCRVISRSQGKEYSWHIVNHGQTCLGHASLPSQCPVLCPLPLMT